VIDLEDGARVNVNIAASVQTGNLRGFVVQSDKPVAAALVVLAPAAGPTNLFNYRGFQAGRDGSFDFNAVPSGDYVLFAIDDPEFEYANLELLRPYLENGKRIRIQPRDMKTETIGLTSVAFNF